MPSIYHVGQRISFKSATGTIRYIGAVEGTDKEWLGIEWDDILRGKHDGTHKGKKYFDCKSSSQTAASFIPSTTKADPSRSFVEAVFQKYATIGNHSEIPIPIDRQIEISGKVVEEVGFNKIRQQQAQLDRLKIVIVDGFRIDIADTAQKRIRDVCPRVVDLDLSRNLFDDYKEIVKICAELDDLQSLRLNGNRLRVVDRDFPNTGSPFKGIKELEMNEMLASWPEICEVASRFSDLEQLKASMNNLKSLDSSRSFSMPHLWSLTLDSNEITSLADLEVLCGLDTLERLYLRGNLISKITRPGQKKPMFGSKLHYVDLSSNKITSWAFVDELSVVFPGLTALRFSNNPIYDSQSQKGALATISDEAYMLTIARTKNLKSLNFSNITAKDRENAELFYLSRIGMELANVSESEEQSVLARHKRYHEICEVHGAPVVVRRDKNATDPNFVEGRLINFSFQLVSEIRQQSESGTQRQLEIPKSFDVYRVKGIVGRLFGIAPVKIRLVWETGEWDPIAEYEEEVDGSGGEDDDSNAGVADAEREALRRNGIWVRREVEIEDGLRQIGYWVDGTQATVRIEII